jgi:hypothetical protein
MKAERSLWPLGITLAFALFAAGIATMVVVACTHKADLIQPDYYDQEIKYQSQLDRLNRTAQLSETVKITYDESSHRITVLLPASHAGRNAVGRIQLYRPSAMGLDRELPLQFDADGVQILDATGLIPGLWKVRVQWTVENKEFFADQKVIIGAKARADAFHTRSESRRVGTGASLSLLN